MDGVELVNAQVSQIRVDSGGPQACEVFGTSLLDSVCDDMRFQGTAVVSRALAGETNISTLRNVTAVADNSGTGVLCDAAGGSTGSLELDNTIAFSQYVGIEADAKGHSSCAVAGTNDVTGPIGIGDDGTSTETVNPQNPVKGRVLLVDPEHGDFHEAAGSSTIDAGNAQDAPGPNDLDGLPRVMGSAPDVGAYEHPVPATITTTTQSSHGSHTHVVTTVDTHGLPGVAELVATHRNGTFTSHHKALAAKVGPQQVSMRLKHVHLRPQDTLQVVVTDAGGTTKQSLSTAHYGGHRRAREGDRR